KKKLILLVLTDHDPEGIDIPHSFARSMRDDFGIEDKDIVLIKVALTPAHVARFGLQPNNLEAKKEGARYKRFVELYGNDGYELEALAPAVLQQLLRNAIDSVLDTAAFNHEIEFEKQDAAHLGAVRRAVQEQLASVTFA